MRSFGIVSPQFWTGNTGRVLRDKGPVIQLLAVYLMTSPHSHMCGLYYLPLQYIAYETGMAVKSIRGALSELQNEKFAYYDEGTEFVWVKEMSHWQLGALKLNDGRATSIRRWYDSLAPNPFIGLFFERYKDELQLSHKRDLKAPPEGAGDGGVGGPRGPIPPSPDPVLVPILEGGPGETKKHGEYGNAELTSEQETKLRAQLNGNFDYYVRKFDRWKEQNKHLRKYRNRSAYLTIPDWFERDVAEGKIPQARASPPQNDPAVVEQERQRLFGKKAKA